MCILYTRTHTDMPRISPHVYFIYMYMCMCMCSLYICTCVLYTRLQIPMCRELHVHVSSTKVHMYMCINYTCTFYTHVRIPISRDSVQLDSSGSPAATDCNSLLQSVAVRFFGLSSCLVPTPGLTPEYPTCSVCV